MPLHFIQNDIAKVKADILVNSANPEVAIGTGCDANLHAAAGPQLFEARKKIGPIATGEACITDAYNLPAKYVIHTVAPIWQDGHHKEGMLLKRCYDNCLKLAEEYKADSIAFPLLSTGNYAFPKDLALDIAVNKCEKWLKDHELTIYIVVYDRESYQISLDLHHEVETFINNALSIEPAPSLTYGQRRKLLASMSSAPYVLHEQEEADDEIVSYEPAVGYTGALSLSSIDGLPEFKAGKSFQDTLFEFCDRSGMSDPEIYKRANMDRKLFSKIKNPKYLPRKNTILSLAIALRLNLKDTNRLLASAGYAMSDGQVSDIIIRYFIQTKHYDIYDINTVLFEYHQPTLGV